MLRSRLITGISLIAGLLGLVWLDSALESWPLSGLWRTIADTLGWHHDTAPRGTVVFLLALALVPLIAREATRMLEHVNVAASRRLAMVAATTTFVALALVPSLTSTHTATAIDATVLVGVFVAGLIRFSRGHNVHGVMAATGGLLLVTVYAGVLTAFWIFIRRDHSAWLLVGAMLTTKSCDIGAYFTGVSIGRHKLIPWLSPKKTWEGLVGGVVTAAVVGCVLAVASEQLPNAADHVAWWIGAVGGAIVGVVGQCGDLAESLFKRDAGLKDSGRLLPGMGGVLDVLDSPLLTGPAIYWLLVLSRGGDGG
ncbi:MAG: phosphatidate cytidylyltransferase [Phycisphaerae bacterium]|nr:phosphatidate cytidylyltransferase [Phycisphaerae bacterium]